MKHCIDVYILDRQRQCKQSVIANKHGNLVKWHLYLKAPATLGLLPGVEVIPGPLGQINAAGGTLAVKDRGCQESFSDHKLIVNGPELRVIRIIHHKRPDGRKSFLVVAVKCGIQMGDQRHPQIKYFLAFSGQLLMVLQPFSLAVFLIVVLLPGRRWDHEAVNDCLRGKDNSLDTAEQLLLGFGLADFWRPEQAGAGGAGHPADEVGVIIEIAVQHIGIWSGKCA